MSSPSIVSFLLVFCLFGFLGCAGPEEGVYTGKIGKKEEVTIRIKTDGLVGLEGYWKQPLKGGHERGSLRGKDMDALLQRAGFPMGQLYQWGSRIYSSAK